MQGYRSFLYGLLDTLVECVREAENMGWHHLPDGHPSWMHYLRLLTAAQGVHERIVRYDAIKARSQPTGRWTGIQAPASQDAMVGYANQLHLDAERAVHPELTGERGGSGRAGDDGHKDDNQSLREGEQYVSDNWSE